MTLNTRPRVTGVSNDTVGGYMYALEGRFKTSLLGLFLREWACASFSAVVWREIQVLLEYTIRTYNTKRRYSPTVIASYLLFSEVSWSPLHIWTIFSSYDNFRHTDRFLLIWVRRTGKYVAKDIAMDMNGWDIPVFISLETVLVSWVSVACISREHQHCVGIYKVFSLNVLSLGILDHVYITRDRYYFHDKYIFLMLQGNNITDPLVCFSWCPRTQSPGYSYNFS